MSEQPVPDPSCVFCAIADGRTPAIIIREWPDVIAIRPCDGGVTYGHVLVIPRAHVADAGADPAVAARTMTCAAELMAEHPAANIITSRGSAATQTVFHLNIHVIPRVIDDGLLLPWTVERLPATTDLSTEQAAQTLADQAQFAGMSVKDGMATLEVVPPHEIVLAWVQAARGMLGDATNYSETRIDFPKVEMEVKEG
jgi:histidine triad (HIT) family protein